RDLSAEADRTEKQRRARQPIDEPARGDSGNPRAHQRHALTAEKQAVVPVSERSGYVRTRLVGSRHGSARRKLETEKKRGKYLPRRSGARETIAPLAWHTGADDI